VLVLLLSFLSGFAAAQLPGAAATDMASHGWVVVQTPGERSATLAHLPPRTPTQFAEPAPSGRMRAVASMTVVPTHVAADGASVYLLLPPGRTGERQIMMLSVRPTGVRDLWVREPESRLILAGTLEKADEVFGLAFHEERMHALVRRDGEITLLERTGSAWKQIEHPPIDADGAEITLASSEAGLHILGRSASDWREFTLSHGEWMSHAIELPEESSDLNVVGFWRDEVIALGTRAGRGVVWSLGAGEPLLLGMTDPVGANASSAVLHSSGRLVLAWSVPGEVTGETGSGLPAPEEVSNPVRRVLEFDLVNGLTLYAGPANVTSPVSPGEFRLLAFSLMLMMAVVLLVVLRPQADPGAIVLPVGLAIAGPGRRLMASAFDGLIGVAVVAQMLDMSVVDVLGPLALPITGSLDVGPLALAIMVNIAHCAASEAFFGRTIGKAMTGLIVARVDLASAGLPPGQFRPPVFWRSFVRNLIKWVLPPVAMLALSDPSGRHRGDLIARSAVLCRANEPLSDQ